MFARDSGALEHIAKTDDSVDRWDRLASGRPPVVYFWYRTSPQGMVPESAMREVAADDPPFVIPGMARLALDTLGRLLYFEAVPPRWEEAPPPEKDPDWSVLFAEAELDQAKFVPATPSWTPQVYCDHRAAWTGAHPAQPESKIRIEAGAFHGRPVFFRLVEPWEARPESESRFGPRAKMPVGAAVLTAIVLALAACVYLAWRNYRSGRGDRRGALRLAFYVLVALTGADLFASHHVWDAREAELVFTALAEDIMMGAFCLLFYLAIEPYARRYWPHSLITWSRLLNGRFRDPLVGREVLYGCLAGAWLGVVTRLKDMIPIWMGEPAPPVLGYVYTGGRYVVATLLASQLMVVIGLAFFAMLLLLRILLRRPWLACGALFTFFVLALTSAFTAPLWQCVVVPVSCATMILVLVRWGLLASLALFLVWILTWAFPTTFDFSAWYAGYALWGPLVALALAVYSAWVSLAGRPLFGDELLKA
jgi:serine/threonine-protein kinase